MLGPDAEIFDALLRYDPSPSAYLGVGSFKTTTRAQLTFKGINFPNSGLGVLVRSQTKNGRMPVALKRPYRNKRGASGPGGRGGGKARLAYVEEEVAIFEECKLLVWANSLLKVAYDFVTDFMHSHPSGAPPPFEILQFRFVAAGMAISQKLIDNGRSSTTNRAAYLLEEVLPGVESDFVKYLHNASAASELSTDDPDYQLAQFLMFIQHVQYAITGGVAYVSDFQGTVRVFYLSQALTSLLGVGTCLTDPQILTSPYVRCCLPLKTQKDS